MKFISWNVNGLRAIVKKNFMDVFKQQMQTSFAFRKPNYKLGKST